MNSINNMEDKLGQTHRKKREKIKPAQRTREKP